MAHGYPSRDESMGRVPWSYSFFKRAPPATVENLITRPNPGETIRIVHAHGNIQAGSDGKTVRHFMAYVYHPNEYGAHFGDGPRLFTIDAVLQPGSQTNSATGSFSPRGSGYLTGQNVETNLLWTQPIDLVETMAVAYHWRGPPDDTIDLQLDGWRITW